MTTYPVIYGGVQYAPDAPPAWRFSRLTAATLNEGEVFSFSFVCNNRLSTSRIIWALSGPAGNARFEENWTTLMTQVCAENGLTYTAVGNAVHLATIGGRIDMTEAYGGQTITVSNRIKLDRKNNAPTAGGSQSTFLAAKKVDAGDPDSVTNNPNQTNILDTSRTPTDYPTLRLRNFSLTGGTSPSTITEGDGFEVVLETEYMLPGTKVKVYAANAGQSQISPAMRPTLKPAIEATPGCTIEYPPDAAGIYYNGLTIVYGESYSDATPVRFNIYAASDGVAEAPLQIDIIATVTTEGSASDIATTPVDRGTFAASGVTYTLGDYVASSGVLYLFISTTNGLGVNLTNTARWRIYQPILVYAGAVSKFIADVPKRYWEMRATRSGMIATYTIQCPNGAPTDTATLTSTGAPAGFASAFAAALAAQSTISYASGVLSSSATTVAASSLTFTVTLTGADTGKHVLSLGSPTGASPIVIADACVFLTTPTLPSDPAFSVGVNLSGGEFGSNLPGTYGTDYAYPSEPDQADPRRHQEMDYYWGKGVRIIRLPIRWERIQATLFGSLTGEFVSSWTGRLDIARIDEIITYWTGLGGVVLLDLHNYMNYKGVGKVGYDQPTSTAALADVWVKLANRYASNTKVWFGIMNEPSGKFTGSVRTRDVMHSVVNAIRARTSALNKILVAGTSYSSAQNWVSNGQAAAYDTFYDPANNFAFEPHCYFDLDASGTVGSCTAGANTRLNAITTWARGAGFKLFLGETAGGNPAITGQETCGTVLPAAYTFMDTNRDVWIGWATWGAGRRWTLTYPFRLDPVSYTDPVDQATFLMLEPFL